METFDLIVIGAGISGIMAAVEAKSRGVKKVIIIDRDIEPGGAMLSCVQTGFYYKNIKENLTAPELISELVKDALNQGVIIKCDTTVLELKKNKEVVIVNSTEGINTIAGRAIILAMGSRERPFGYKNILGYGMAGITTACSTLKYINRKGVLPGKRCIILGSDDIGMLAARTLILEGANVINMIETSKSITAVWNSSKEYIEDFNIPILFNHRVVKIYGTHRVTGVDIVELDENYKAIKETCTYVDCDTLVLCMHLKPDTPIAEKVGIDVNKENRGISITEEMETSQRGIFACGAVIDGYTNIEKVMNEGRLAAKYATEYLGI
ncbi:NAD(P)/FAD-dependent oxidoreductase [Clostridium sp. UBA1056]|uniref:NAD(P)/FAD-dependent oxidoreductase n=1 Tax=unclassified Clostridium TaxID=2614128 RepID=UPI00321768E8